MYLGQLNRRQNGFVVLFAGMVVGFGCTAFVVLGCCLVVFSLAVTGSGFLVVGLCEVGLSVMGSCVVGLCVVGLCVVGFCVVGRCVVGFWVVGF